jgi:hypothetical protein
LLIKDEVLLFIYVDDILVMSKTKQTYKIFQDLLKSEFKIEELRKPKYILGFRVEFVKNGFHSLNASLLKKLWELSLSQRKQGLHINAAQFDSKEVFRI